MHFMIDIETLGTLPGSKIISIGAVAFNQKGIIDVFEQDIDRHNQALPLEDPATLDWWETQSPTAQLVLNSPNAVSLPIALGRLTGFILANTPENEEPRIWGNGANFDGVLLTMAYHAENMEKPWKFYHERCYRTMKALNPHVKMNRTGTHHNALDDAKSQATHLLEILENTGTPLN